MRIRDWELAVGIPMARRFVSALPNTRYTKPRIKPVLRSVMATNASQRPIFTAVADFTPLSRFEGV